MLAVAETPQAPALTVAIGCSESTGRHTPYWGAAFMRVMTMPCAERGKRGGEPNRPDLAAPVGLFKR